MQITNKPALSIIVPIYNVEKYIHKCVDSILNQSFNDFELILIDDGSPDNCGKICDEYEQKDSRVIVIHKKNSGLGSSRNFGLSIAKGEYVSFVDSDDWIENNAYYDLMKLARDNNADIVRFGWFEDTENGSTPQSDDLNGKITDKTALIKDFLIDKVESQAWKNIYKKMLFDDIAFANHIYEDIPCIYKVFLKAKSIYATKNSYYHYIIRKNSITTSKNPWRSYYIFLGIKNKLDYISDTKEYNDIYIEVLHQALYHALQTYKVQIRHKNLSSKIYKSLIAFINNNISNIIKEKVPLLFKTELIFFKYIRLIYNALFMIKYSINDQ